MKVPLFPLVQLPEHWDELTLLAATVQLEAEGESDEGKAAVAWVIQNRSTGWKRPIGQIILEKNQFACWNADVRIRAEARLSAAEESVRERCWRAAAGAYWRLIVNPVPEALFYLNVEVAKKQRGGTLPSWAADPKDSTRVDQAKVVAVIGNHSFLRA